MNTDTPLTEVAHHLPPATAALLGEHDPRIQSAVLSEVRDFVIRLEAIGTLDAISYGAVLHAYVVTTIPTMQNTHELLIRLQYIQKMAVVEP